MEKNFTPLDTKKIENNNLKLKQEPTNLNTVLLIIATLTAIVLAVMLFILIQKKIKNQDLPEVISPTPMLEITPTTIIEETPVFQATATPTINLEEKNASPSVLPP